VEWRGNRAYVVARNGEMLEDLCREVGVSMDQV
jgi:hypothetical protein